jgi:glyoxylase-like metal-dependent hydrolase (beta-lactamase superfamily II)
MKRISQTAGWSAAVIVGIAAAAVGFGRHASLLAQSGAATPPAQLIAGAAEALGGSARLMAVRTLAIDGEGVQWANAGGVSPLAEPNRTKITGYTRVFDIANRRMRITQTGTIQYPFALGLRNQLDQRLDGDIAFGAGGRGAAPGTLARANQAAWHQRRVDYLSHPLTAIRAALDPAAKVVNHSPATQADERLVDVTTPQGETYTLSIPANGAPRSIRWNEADPNWGDVVIRTVFLDYVDVNGVKLPTRVETFMDRTMTADLRVTNTIDGDVGDLAAPESVKSAPAPQPAAQPIMVTADPVAKGVWYMGGTGEHSVLFEFADHLVLFETPGPEARTLAVIQKARETVPGKPLTIAINSHHHFDHAGGFRAAVSEGLTMYAYQDNVEHFKEIARRPHTLSPDVLQRKPRALKIMPVGDMLEMKDSQMDIVIYHVRPSAITHAATELMVWVPRDRLLLEADQVDLGWTRHLWGENFIWNVEQLRRLPVDRILPVHGNGPEPWTEVVKTIRSKATYYPTDVPGF